jgi:hypothetical protein
MSNPARLNRHSDTLMTMAATIASGMMSTTDRGTPITYEDEQFVARVSTNLAYMIAHKVLDDAFAAEQEAEACYEEFYRHVR